MTTLQFWKPGTVGPGSSVDRASESEDLVAPSGPSTWSSLGIQAQRQRLPVYQHSNVRLTSFSFSTEVLRRG